MIEFARARIGYKPPEQIVILDQMPLNATGKVDRVALKRLAEEHLAAAPARSLERRDCRLERNCRTS